LVDVGRCRRRGHWPGRIGLLLLGYSAQATASSAVKPASFLPLPLASKVRARWLRILSMPASAQSAATKSGFPKTRFFAVYSVCRPTVSRCAAIISPWGFGPDGQSRCEAVPRAYSMAGSSWSPRRSRNSVRQGCAPAPGATATAHPLNPMVLPFTCSHHSGGVSAI
jgi:hypothetical protein